MKTRDEAEAYLNSIKRWKDDLGDVADSGPRHSEFYSFKETIELDGQQFAFLSTNSDKALKGEPHFEEEDIMWHFDVSGVGKATLHLYCFDEADMTGSWGELWLENEPWWNGDDPYECTEAQLGALVRALPEEHLKRFVQLASRKPGFVEGLAEAGILPEQFAAPAPL